MAAKKDRQPRLRLSTLGAVVPMAFASMFLNTLPFATANTHTLVEASATQAVFVGRKTCAQCHQKQDKLWLGSHHDLAMQVADQKSVLGDFNDVRFTYAGVESTFYKRNGKFMVRTDGPGGKLHDYSIKYTFGVYPLQQYLVEFPGGRLQALSIAWDSRPKSVGGQRWFHLYPDEKIAHDDVLHWTGLNQNWNHMCAGCHSTNLKKNYQPEIGRASCRERV